MEFDVVVSRAFVRRACDASRRVLGVGCERPPPRGTTNTVVSVGGLGHSCRRDGALLIAFFLPSAVGHSSLNHGKRTTRCLADLGTRGTTIDYAPAAMVAHGNSRSAARQPGHANFTLPEQSSSGIYLLSAASDRCRKTAAPHRSQVTQVS